jgi:hypothetical protein
MEMMTMEAIKATSTSDLMDILYWTKSADDSFKEIVKELLARGVDVKCEALTYYGKLLRLANQEKTGANRNKLIDRAEKFSADAYYPPDRFKEVV